jgi:hypothetical protein
MIIGALLISSQPLMLPLLLLHPPAAVADLQKVICATIGHDNASFLTQISCIATGTFTDADIREIKESLQRLEQIVLTMCEQQNINLSNADLTGLAPNTPSAGMPSPLGNFHGLSIGRGSCGSSAHSGGHACK